MTATGIIDTHCHLFHKRLREDGADVARRAFAAGVAACVVPSVDVADSRRACQLAEEAARGAWHGISLGVAVGVHPHQVALQEGGGGLDAAMAELRLLALGETVVAIGEIGLDLARGADSLELQLRWLRAQMALASELRLPVILHTRDAAEVVVHELHAWLGAERRGGGTPEAAAPAGVLHAYTGHAGLSRTAGELNLALGVGGIATFTRESALRSDLARQPIERLVVETDAPYLAPHPRRGRRNEPALITHIVQCLAAEHAVSSEVLAAATRANALALFPRLAPLL